MIKHKKLKDILRGLVRFKRVNEEDMPMLAEIVGMYIAYELHVSPDLNKKGKYLFEAQEYYKAQKKRNL